MVNTSTNPISNNRATQTTKEDLAQQQKAAQTQAEKAAVPGEAGYTGSKSTGTDNPRRRSK